MSMNNIIDALSKVTGYFRNGPQSAQVAKERLQIIISHERVRRDQPDYLASLQRDLIEVIAKYVSINKEDVRVELENQDGCSVLELNVVLPQASK